MLARVLVVAVLILGLMVAIKDGRLARSAGLTGACWTLKSSSDGSELDVCRPGKLEGRPDLSGHGCTSTGIKGRYEYWHCPAPVVPSQVGR